MKIARALWVLSRTTHTVTQPQHPLAAWLAKWRIGGLSHYWCRHLCQEYLCSVRNRPHDCSSGQCGRLSALIRLAGLSLTDAANRIVHEELGMLVSSCSGQIGYNCTALQFWACSEATFRGGDPSSNLVAQGVRLMSFIIHHELDSNVHHIELNNGSETPINAQLIAELHPAMQSYTDKPRSAAPQFILREDL